MELYINGPNEISKKYGSGAMFHEIIDRCWYVC
jgi:hypothetical protein